MRESYVKIIEGWPIRFLYYPRTGLFGWEMLSSNPNSTATMPGEGSASTPRKIEAKVRHHLRKERGIATWPPTRRDPPSSRRKVHSISEIRELKPRSHSPRGIERPIGGGFILAVYPYPFGRRQVAWHVYHSRNPNEWYATGEADGFDDAMDAADRKFGVNHRAIARDGRSSRRRPHPLSPHPTRRQRTFIGKKIPILIDEGYPQQQAIAIAYRMAGVPPRRGATKRARSRSRSRSRRDLDMPARMKLNRIYKATGQVGPVVNSEGWLVFADAIEDVGEERLAEDLRKFVRRVRRLNAEASAERPNPRQPSPYAVRAAGEQFLRLQRRIERVIHEERSRRDFSGVRMCPCPSETPRMLTFDPEDPYFA